MKRKGQNILVMIFQSHHHGEVMVMLYHPREDLTMKIVREEAYRLIPLYCSKKGVRLKVLKSAFVIKRHKQAII